MKKHIVLGIISILVILVGFVVFRGGDGSLQQNEQQEPVEAVTIEDGVQYINIQARAGYAPKNVEAQANMPTVIRMATNNTFDCSSSLVIPSISYSGYLKPTGVEEIEIPLDQTTGTLQGLCSMGMYSFSVNFL